MWDGNIWRKHTFFTSTGINCIYLLLERQSKMSCNLWKCAFTFTYSENRHQIQRVKKRIIIIKAIFAYLVRDNSEISEREKGGGEIKQ